MAWFLSDLDASCPGSERCLWDCSVGTDQSFADDSWGDFVDSGIAGRAEKHPRLSLLPTARRAEISLTMVSLEVSESAEIHPRDMHRLLH